uniref:Nucleotide-diphospho-sugar transferase domain-containing protein n=1 Tax=Scylla olivacea TaxID=85551 RepID=A0A0P4W1F7_SCYOL
MRLMRSVVGGCVFVVASVVLLSTLTSTPPTGPAIHSIVAHNLKEELEGSMTCDEEDLERLGFVDGPQLYPHHAWDNLSTPVLASAVWSGQVWQVEGLAGLAQLLLPNLTLMVYSLDLPTYEMQQLEEVCNTSCVVVPFDFSLYPSHVRDHHLRAYRPIIIQELLVRAGAVFWLDAGVRLAGSEEGSVAGEEVERLAEEWSSQALRSGGVLAWPLTDPPQLPSAALTHPNMFTFFHTKKHNYDFQQMGDAGTLLLYNTEGVHRHLMRPWVSCALTHNCISPIGAQDTGCRYDKKPLFRYSGCHHYDASAFNVALGVMFSYDTRPYLASASPFVRVKAKPQPDSDAPLAGRGEEDEATNTSSLRDTLSRRPLGVGRKTDRTLRGLEMMHRTTRSNSTSRAGSKRLGERERERESHTKHIVAINATRRRVSDEGSRRIY